MIKSHDHLHRFRKKKNLTKHSPFLMKSLNKVDMEGPYLNILKTICDELKANIILNSKKLKVLPLKSEIKQKSLFLPYLFNPILLSPSRSNQTRKRKKIHPN